MSSLLSFNGAVLQDSSNHLLTIDTVPTASIQSNKNVTPAATATVVTPDSGYTALAQVTVAAATGGAAITDATASAGDILYGKVAYNNNGSVTGTIVPRTSNGLVMSGSTATLSSGYYSSSFSKNVAAGTISATYTSEALTANYMTQFTISPTVVASGWVSQAGTNTQSFILSTADFTAGTITISENGTHDVAQYSYASVNVPTGGGGAVESLTGANWLVLSDDYTALAQSNTVYIPFSAGVVPNNIIITHVNGNALYGAHVIQKFGSGATGRYALSTAFGNILSTNFSIFSSTKTKNQITANTSYLKITGPINTFYASQITNFTMFYWD